MVKLGKMDIEVLHTPGHTPGGVTLKVGDVLLTGDTLFQGSMGRTDFEGGSYAEIMASLGRLGRLSGDYHVLPGHIGGLHPGAGAQDQLLPAGGHGGIRRKAAAPGERTRPMKLYLHGHDYKYAAEQMLLVPHGSSAPAGAPFDLLCIAGRK